ncbi:hypothetical protein ACFL54_00035 [Planctomycetota bacterium]
MSQNGHPDNGSPENGKFNKVFTEYLKQAAPRPDLKNRILAGIPAASPHERGKKGHIKAALLAVGALAAAVLIAVLMNYSPTSPVEPDDSKTLTLERMTLRGTFTRGVKRPLAVLESDVNGDMSLFQEGYVIGRHRLIGITGEEARFQSLSEEDIEMILEVESFPEEDPESVRRQTAEFAAQVKRNSLSKTDFCRVALWAKEMHRPALELLRSLAKEKEAIFSKDAEFIIAGGDIASVDRLLKVLENPKHPYRGDAFRRLMKMDNMLAGDIIRQIAGDPKDRFHKQATAFLEDKKQESVESKKE